MILPQAIFILLIAMPAGVRPCEGEGCNEWASLIAGACEFGGQAMGVDPWELAAIAHHETRFDPDRESPSGKGLGIFGINPKTRMGPRVAAWCTLGRTTCLLGQAIEAAAYLRWERRRCKSWSGAIRSYGSGHCDGPLKYLRGHRLSLAMLKVRR